MKNKNWIKNWVKNWIWGIFFICAAALVVLYCLGTFSFTGVGAFGIVLTVLLLAVVIGSIINLNFFGITIPIAFILTIFEKELAPVEGFAKGLMPWGVLAAAVFLAIGLTVLFKPIKFFNRIHGNGHCNKNAGGSTTLGKNDTIEVDGEAVEDEVNVNVSFGESTKYIYSKNFRKASIYCSFGAAKVFFNDSEMNPGGAEIVINSSFSGIELYIPRKWRVNNDLNTTLGGVEEKNKMYVESGPILNLTGSVKLGGISILYV